MSKSDSKMLVIPLVLSTVIWNSATIGVAGLTCHRCMYDKDPDLCSDPWPVGSTTESQLLKCPLTASFCQVGIRLIPTVNPLNNKIGFLMGRNCANPDTGTSRTKNLKLWIGRATESSSIACEERRSLVDDKTVTDFRCICPHDNCNNQTLREILQLRMDEPFFDQERMKLVGVRFAEKFVGETSENYTASSEMTGTGGNRS